MPLIRVAAVGCTHGELDTLYRLVAEDERKTGKKVDLLICCGDFQAIRNNGDLYHLHCPEKYRDLRTFHKYYSGQLVAPVLTLFIGGNHESTAYSQELPHGGWVAPRIYYMGFGSVVNFGGLRIAGWSGIFKQHDYTLTHYELPPFERGQQVSAYHVRASEHFRFGLLDPGNLDVFLTHDWPCGVTKHGNEQQLLRAKPHFREDIHNNCLGNPHSMHLLQQLQPRWFFAGHMHAHFQADVPHPDKVTRFRALGKCMPGSDANRFLLFQDIEVAESLATEKVLHYDAEWLTVLKNTAQFENNTRKNQVTIPQTPDAFKPSPTQVDEVKERFGGDLTIPDNFKPTAPTEEALRAQQAQTCGALYYRNPQTRLFCEKLGIPDWNEKLCIEHGDVVGIPFYAHLEAESVHEAGNASEIVLDDTILLNDDDEEDFFEDPTPQTRQKRSVDPDDDVETTKKTKVGES